MSGKGQPFCLGFKVLNTDLSPDTELGAALAGGSRGEAVLEEDPLARENLNSGRFAGWATDAGLLVDAATSNSDLSFCLACEEKWKGKRNKIS